MLHHEKLTRILIREREAARSHHMTLQAALRQARAATPNASPRRRRWSWPALADRLRASARDRARSRARRRALERALSAFAAEMPSWAASAFDLRLLEGPGAEALASLDVEALALAWARQFRYVDERRRARDLRLLRPVVETFLARFREALERQGVSAHSAPARPTPAHPTSERPATAHPTTAHPTTARTPRGAPARPRRTPRWGPRAAGPRGRVTGSRSAAPKGEGPERGPRTSTADPASGPGECGTEPAPDRAVAERPAPAPLWSALRPAPTGADPCCASADAGCAAASATERC